MPTVALGTPTEQALSLPAAAKLLPISESQLRELVREGKVPSTKIGRQYFIFLSDLAGSPLGALWR